MSIRLRDEHIPRYVTYIRKIVQEVKSLCPVFPSLYRTSHQPALPVDIVALISLYIITAMLPDYMTVCFLCTYFSTDLLATTQHVPQVGPASAYSRLEERRKWDLLWKRNTAGREDYRSEHPVKDVASADRPAESDTSILRGDSRKLAFPDSNSQQVQGAADPPATQASSSSHASSYDSSMSGSLSSIKHRAAQAIQKHSHHHHALSSASRFAPQRRLEGISRQIHSSTSTMNGHSALREVVIVSAKRTPVGSFNGALKKLTAPELGAAAIKAAVADAGIDPSAVQDVYMGNVLQAAVGQSPARQAAIKAGLGKETEATTINKVCASGMKAIMLASQGIMTGDRDVSVAGGMESMSNTPYAFPRNAGFGNQTALDLISHDGLTDVYNKFPMGNCAEKTAKDYNITREDQDEFAINSYKKAAEAWSNGVYAKEVVPVTIPDRKASITVSEDEEYKNIKFDKVKSLNPVFVRDGSGTITAANASNINDGASAVVLMSQEKASELGAKPLAKIVAFADGAVDPIDFPVAPALKAIPNALKKAGLEAKDIARWEINEAFSVVVPASVKVLGIDPATVNVHGGAVALGHAIGSSGSRIVVSLVHSLEKAGDYGCAAVCNGGGGASAIIVQKL